MFGCYVHHEQICNFEVLVHVEIYITPYSLQYF